MGLGDSYDYGINSPLDYSSEEEAEMSYIAFPAPVRRSLWDTETAIGLTEPTVLTEPIAEPQCGFPEQRLFTDYEAHTNQIESLHEQLKSLEYATTEAFEDYETDLNLLKDLQKESEVKNARLENLLAELGKKKPMFNFGTYLVVVGCLSMVVVGLAIQMFIK